MSRWRNAGLYVALIALIPLILQTFGIEVLPAQWAAFKELANGILSLLVTAGILSNPTTTTAWFHDDPNPPTLKDQINAEKNGGRR
jgi:uncharacterized membrane protein